MELRISNVARIKKNDIVRLSKELPVGFGFGNKSPISEGTKGYVKSEGYVNGFLEVEFYSHYHGTQLTKFNPLSADNFLLYILI